MGRGDQRMPWRRLCFARLCRMNVKFSDARSIRPWDFACSATFGAAPDSTGERKPHIQTLRKSPKFPGNRITVEKYDAAVGGHAGDGDRVACGGRPGGRELRLRTRRIVGRAEPAEGSAAGGSGHDGRVARDAKAAA